MIPKIRPMQQSDVDRVYEIEMMSHRAPWSRDLLSDCVLVGYDCRVVESKKRQIEGYVICRYSDNLCHILNLCVAVPAQRKGYGKLLLKSVLASLLDSRLNPKLNSKVDTVILEVRPSNIAAIALYKKFGFSNDAIKKGYYQDNGSEEDAIILKKIIPPGKKKSI